jgi:hypothetical protein
MPEEKLRDYLAQCLSECGVNEDECYEQADAIIEGMGKWLKD